MEHRPADSPPVLRTANGIRATWPLRASDFGALLAFYVLMTLVWTGVGKIIKGSDGTVVDADRRIEEWLVERRTPTLNDASWVGSMLSETAVKIALTAIVGLVLLRVLRRWLDTLVICVSLIIEAMIFLTVTQIVGRPRPDVPKLDGSPVSSSFPSGHVAAATCYAAMAVVVFWHTRRFWLRLLTVVVTILVPVAVALARMYRGMHHLTDVVAGAIIGAMCVAFVTWLLMRAEERRLANEADRANDAATAAPRPLHAATRVTAGGARAEK